jgi:hypothetical protein
VLDLLEGLEGQIELLAAQGLKHHVLQQLIHAHAADPLTGSKPV